MYINIFVWNSVKLNEIAHVSILKRRWLHLRGKIILKKKLKKTSNYLWNLSSGHSFWYPRTNDYGKVMIRFFFYFKCTAAVCEAEATTTADKTYHFLWSRWSFFFIFLVFWVLVFFFPLRLFLAWSFYRATVLCGLTRGRCFNYRLLTRFSLTYNLFR